jgi:hypothetical protein
VPNDFAPLPNSCLFPGDVFYFSPRRSLQISPLPEFIFISRFSYRRFQAFRTPFHTFSPSTVYSDSTRSNISSHLSALPVDDVSDRIQRLSLHISPFSEVTDINTLFELADESDDHSDHTPQQPDAHFDDRSASDMLSAETVPAVAPDSPAESESPISSVHKSGRTFRHTATAANLSPDTASGTRSSVKRGAESSPENADPVVETQTKKPVLRFRKLKVARQLFDQTQSDDMQLEHMFSNMGIGTPADEEHDDDDEEPISIKSGSGRSSSTVRSFFLTISPVAGQIPAEDVTSSPKSWNSHSCEYSHNDGQSGLWSGQTQ